MDHFWKRWLELIAKTYGFFACLPAIRRRPRISPPKYVAHGSWEDYLSQRFNKPGMRILEIGSRNVTGANLRHRFSSAEYVGFDIMEGENVDIVGDAHQLSQYFQDDDQFDLIFSSAVFEHLHMPWIVVEEIRKLLSINGCVFVETHFSFSSHERPWNFFQFSDMGLMALFNRGIGFKLLDKGMSNPIVGYFGPSSKRYLRFLPLFELYCHSEILCEKVEDVGEVDWKKLSIDDVVAGTRYPAPR